MFIRLCRVQVAFDRSTTLIVFSYTKVSLGGNSHDDLETKKLLSSMSSEAKRRYEALMTSQGCVVFKAKSVN
jgi:hypothetical protein